MTHSSSRPAAAEEFALLHAEVAPRLWAWVALRLGAGLRSRVEVQDVVQEVSCRAWRRFSEYDRERGTFLAWTFGIARNVLGELLARMARGEACANGWSTDLWAQIPEEATSVTERMSREEHLDEFARWAASLSVDDQRLLLYRGLEGWPHAKVAEVLGVSDNVAQQRWAALTRRLREHPSVLLLLHR